jgi:hypothetical protein
MTKPLYFIINNEYQINYDDFYDSDKFFEMDNLYVYSFDGITDDFKHKDVIKVRGLKKLLKKFYLEYDFYDIDELAESILMEDYLIFSYDKFKKTVTKAVESSILDILSEIKAEIIYAQTMNMNSSSVINKMELSSRSEIDEFLDKVESNIENSAHLVMSIDYDGMIIKKNSSDHKKYEDDLEYADERNGFIYEHGIFTTKIHIARILLDNGIIGFSLSERVGEYYKKFGFIMIYNEGVINMSQLSARDVLESYSSIDGVEIDMSYNKNFIFCGPDKDDVICGFDLI